MGIRTQTLNNAKDWNESRRYKVNEVVKKQGFFYQNITGKNSDPFLLTDWIVVGKIEPKVYKALLSQVGTDAPTAIVIVNTLGFIPTWIRDSAGVYYTINNAGSFPMEKTFVLGLRNMSNFDINGYVINDNSVWFEVTDIESLNPQVASPIENVMVRTSILIEVYP